MPPSNGFSPRSGHTVVLQPRTTHASRPLNIGSKQGHFSYARGSPPHPPPRCIREPAHPPPKNKAPHEFERENTQAEATDLLVRFGIDSPFGRVVTRILVLLLLTQPVYVAMGMELDDGTVELTTQEDENEETIMQGEEQTVSSDVQEVSEDEGKTIESDSEVVFDDVMESVGEEEAEIDSGEQVDDENGAVLGDATEAEEESGGDGTVVDDTEVNEETDVVDEDTISETETGEEDIVDDNAEVQATDEGEAVSDEEGETADEETDVVDEIDDVISEENTDDESDVGGSSGGSSGGSANEDISEDGTGDEETDINKDTSEADADTGDTSEENTDTATNESVGDEESDTSTETQDEASTTPEAVEEVLNVAQNPESKYVFGEGDCTLVSDGEFYCVAEGPERQQMLGDPRVYSEKDREGDKEIFYFDGIEVQRVTNNGYDDFAPMFDEENLRIVWQAMLNDRLQIMIHDLPTNSTRQITTSRQNSSNPSIAGDTVVWQEWIDTNWEILMTDVDTNGQEFEIERLTDNVVHDMFPAAYDDLVTWQSERGGSWEVIVYDLHTGKKHALEKDEDTKYENPRFVLLFDSKHENGDVETVGYDLDTGEMMELGTKSRPIPDEPLTPKEETPEALVREASTSTQLKTENDGDAEGDSDGNDVVLE